MKLSSLVLVAMLGLVCSSIYLTQVSADFYDLAEDDLIYGYPSIPRVIAMYQYDDSPTFLGGTKVTPFIQVDLKFTTYTMKLDGSDDSRKPKEDKKAAATEVVDAPISNETADKSDEDAATAPTKKDEEPAPAVPEAPVSAPVDTTPAAPAPIPPAAKPSGKKGTKKTPPAGKKIPQSQPRLRSPAARRLHQDNPLDALTLPDLNPNINTPPVPAVPDIEAIIAMKQKEAENADAKPVTSSEEVKPEEAAAAAKEEAVAAAAGAADVINPDQEVKPLSEYPQVQVLILQDTTLEMLGHKDEANGARSYCCTEELSKQGIQGCNQPGTLIVKNGRVHKIMTAAFTDKEVVAGSTAHLKGPDARYDITTTGEHILIISNCDDRLYGYDIQIEGGGTWTNPYGFLPGRLFGFLPFYFGMFVIYVGLTCTWGLLCFIHRKEVAGIQYCISVALVLTLIEVLAWFIDYYSFNQNGVRHMGGIITAIVITVLRLTVSRMLVVSVSIGYPVVRPSLGTSTKVKIVALGVVYFLSEAALEVVTRYAQTNETAEKWRVFLSIPVAVLNAIFYWWIFTALHDLINYLEQQNQAIKLAMYQTFTHVLAGSLVAAVIFAMYQIYFMATNQLALHWSLLWLLDGGFQLILYTIIFICMGWLWRPSSDSRRYAYAELGASGPGSALGGMDEDEEFGEMEMGETGATNGHHSPNTDSAKFTVEEEDEQ